MKKLSILFLLLFVIFSARIFSQETKDVYEIPDKYYRLILVNEYSSPLKIDNPKVIKYKKGSFEKAYTLRNFSNKAIMSFQVKYFDCINNQEMISDVLASDKYSFLPLESTSSLSDEKSFNYLKITENIIKTLGLEISPKPIWFIMVTKVKLADGSVYDGSDKFEMIKEFARNLKINSRLNPSIIESKEKQLDEYVNKIVNKL